VILQESRAAGSEGERKSAGERTGSAPLSTAQSGPVTRLVAEFAAAWGSGRRRSAEAFLESHPGLALEPEAAIRVIYEEICLRRAEGDDVRITELLERFPQWQSELEVLLDCDRLLDAAPGPPEYPTDGDVLGGFHLLAEIGRGARSRCFLAAQPSLSHRHIVLKVTELDHVEHLSLARLQHTHIMPLYSEHQFPGRRLRALCMPYLGGTTLARIKSELARLSPEQLSGQAILDVLDRAQQLSPWPKARASPARRFLAQASHVRSICFLGACLADSLQYAHEKELVHMDVKPSNIIVTADGQPMLLDFHLAREPIAAAARPADGVGGTPGYMSPEQEARVRAAPAGEAGLPAIDARSDLYSLGCVLAEMLAADPPNPAGAGPPQPRRFMPEVSAGLADIVNKCLATDPVDRYADAGTLADDLKRHMADLPLRGVSNRSLIERWRKWCRRQPYALFRVKILLAAAFAAMVIAGVLSWAFVLPRFRAAATALEEGRALLARGDYSQAARTLSRGAALIDGLPGSSRLADDLAATLRLADRSEDAAVLHGIVDRLRFAESAADTPVSSARDVEKHCWALWDSRQSLLAHSGVSLDPEIEQRLRDDLVELAVVGSSLRVRLATTPERTSEAHRAGLKLLEEAESLFGPSHVVYRARQAHAAALGLTSMADAAGRDAARVLPRTAWEFDAGGQVLLANGEVAEAENAFERALCLKPQDFWPNFHQGVCAYRLGKFQDALNAFRVCIALAPTRAECFYNRALAHAALGHKLEASSDYNRALALDASLVAAPLGRRLTNVRAASPTAR
jgi:eukaryotic-like serine/threonine-protein kinase